MCHGNSVKFCLFKYLKLKLSLPRGWKIIFQLILKHLGDQFFFPNGHIFYPEQRNKKFWSLFRVISHELSQWTETENVVSFEFL